MTKNFDKDSWSNFIRPQPMFDVLAKANEQQNAGNYVARMEIGDTTGFRNDLIHFLVSEEAKKEFRYAPSPGNKLLIRAVKETQWATFDSQIYEVSIAPANFLITAALSAITKPGDLVLLPNPGFPTYKLSCDFLHLRIAYYDVDEVGGPSISQEFLTSFFPEVPAAVIVNNPSNPLGIGFPQKIFDAFLDNLEQLNVEIIYDETYVNLVYDNTNVECFRDGGIRIRTFSKEHCAPGLRIGYSLAKSEYATVINDFISLTISCSPEFIQLAVAKYLNSPESKGFINSIKSEMGKRFDFLRDSLPEKALISKPNAAFYAFLEVGDGDRAFESLIIQNVATCPGSKFGSNGKSKIRVSLAGSSATFEHDVEMLKAGLRNFLN